MNTFLAIYLISAFFLLVTAFVVFRVVVRRDYANKKRLTAVSIFAETAVFAAWANIPIIFLPTDWPTIHLGAILAIIGQLTLWGGVGIVALGMITIGWRRLFGQPDDGLLQTGLYRYSRNPQLVGCFFLAIGSAILWPSWYALGWVALYLPLGYWMMKAEEEFLRQVYGEAYGRYCQQVPRFLGRPKPD